jgi:hypothetical protein
MCKQRLLPASRGSCLQAEAPACKQRLLPAPPCPCTCTQLVACPLAYWRPPAHRLSLQADRHQLYRCHLHRQAPGCHAIRSACPLAVSIGNGSNLISSAELSPCASSSAACLPACLPACSLHGGPVDSLQPSGWHRSCHLADGGRRFWQLRLPDRLGDGLPHRRPCSMGLACPGGARWVWMFSFVC